MSWEEFEELTPGMFQALCKRRNIRIRYERLANAITASVVANSQRTKEDDPIVHPYDFVMDQEQAQKKQELTDIKGTIQRNIRAVPFTAPRKKYLEVRQNLITSYKRAGSDIEAIFDQMWPHLKPTKDDE